MASNIANLVVCVCVCVRALMCVFALISKRYISSKEKERDFLSRYLLQSDKLDF
jgi:hypothetical protein